MIPAGRRPRQGVNAEFDDDEPISPHGDGGLVRVRARVAYDGSGFRRLGHPAGQGTPSPAGSKPPWGWFSGCQAGRHGVRRAHRRRVHARDQWLHADVPWPLWAEHERAAKRRLNGLLPASIRVLEITEAPPGFDARFSAMSRSYTYRVADRGEVDPLQRTHVLGWSRPLDLGPMNAAAAPFLGEHDFAAFCRARPGRRRCGACWSSNGIGIRRAWRS